MTISRWRLLPVLGLSGEPEHTARRRVGSGILSALFWGLLLALGVMEQVLLKSAWVRTRPAAGRLLPLSMHVGKVAISWLGVAAILAELRGSEASLLAGLVIGELAAARAAHKTVESLSGAFSLGTEQPFRGVDVVNEESGVSISPTTHNPHGRRSTLRSYPVSWESLNRRERRRAATVNGVCAVESTLGAAEVISLSSSATYRGEEQMLRSMVCAVSSNADPVKGSR